MSDVICTIINIKFIKLNLIIQLLISITNKAIVAHIIDKSELSLITS